MSRNIGIAPELRHVSAVGAKPSNDCDAATSPLDDLVEVEEEITLTMRAEETKRLIAAAFADEPSEALEDDITLDRVCPVAPPPPPSQRLATPRILPISPHSLALVESAPPSTRWRPHVTPALAQAARELLLAEDAHRRGFTLKRKTQLWLVAGIWAMALSLVVVLAWIVNTA